MKRVSLLFFLLFSASYALSAERYVLHTGLPKANSPEVSALFQGKFNNTLDLAGKVSLQVEGSETYCGHQATVIQTRAKIQSEDGSFSIEYQDKEYASCDDSGCKHIGSYSSPLDNKEPIHFYNVPYTANIGDTGLIGEYKNPDSTIESCFWSLEATDDKSLAQLKITCNEINDNLIIGRETASITIDQQGNCKGIAVEYLDTDDASEPGSIVGTFSCPEDRSFLRVL